MTIRTDPITGNVLCGGGGWPSLNAQQRAFAKNPCSWGLAGYIHEFTNSPDGGKWFSKWKLNLCASSLSAAHEGERLGLWIKDENKPYWRHGPLTWPFVLTALAMRDDFHRSAKALAGPAQT